MAVTLLVLPPQTPTTRDWAKRLASALPELSVVVAEDEAAGARAVGRAEAAYGTMPRALLREAARLRRIQAPQAAPPAGWYYPELSAHPAVVSNFHEIYNDYDILLDNSRRFLAGRSLRNVVDKSSWF